MFGIFSKCFSAAKIIKRTHFTDFERKKISTSLRFRQHIEKRLRIIDRNHRTIEVAAVAGDDGIGSLTDG